MDVKKRFLRFLEFSYKTRFLTFFIFGRFFYFLVANFFYPMKPAEILLNLAKLLHKTNFKW